MRNKQLFETLTKSRLFKKTSFRLSIKLDMLMLQTTIRSHDGYKHTSYITQLRPCTVFLRKIFQLNHSCER